MSPTILTVNGFAVRISWLNTRSRTPSCAHRYALPPSGMRADVLPDLLRVPCTMTRKPAALSSISATDCHFNLRHRSCQNCVVPTQRSLPMCRLTPWVSAFDGSNWTPTMSCRGFFIPCLASHGRCANLVASAAAFVASQKQEPLGQMERRVGDRRPARRLRAGESPISSSSRLAKLRQNRARDRRVTIALQSAGWTVLRAWEHERPVAVARRIMRRDSLTGPRCSCAALRAPSTAPPAAAPPAPPAVRATPCAHAPVASRDTAPAAPASARCRSAAASPPPLNPPWAASPRAVTAPP